MPVIYLLRGPSNKLRYLQFRDKDVIQDIVRCFAQVQVDDISHFLLPSLLMLIHIPKESKKKTFFLLHAWKLTSVLDYVNAILLLEDLVM